MSIAKHIVEHKVLAKVAGGFPVPTLDARQVIVWLRAPLDKFSTIALFQSPLAENPQAYKIPLGGMIGHYGARVRKVFTLEPDTEVVWFEEVGKYYDQTVSGAWVNGIPEEVGTLVYPPTLAAPASVEIIPWGKA